MASKYDDYWTGLLPEIRTRLPLAAAGMPVTVDVPGLARSGVRKSWSGVAEVRMRGMTHSSGAHATSLGKTVAASGICVQWPDRVFRFIIGSRGDVLSITGARAAGEPGGNAAARIFMSYRREDTAYPAAWLFERLASEFGRHQVFKDVDSIVPGEDFAEIIAAAVESCHVLLALIGRQWLTLAGQDGRPRLENPADFVRLEIEAALARGVRVIPVLVDGARMPRAQDLPPGLRKLARRQGLELSPVQFDAGAQRLLRALGSVIAEEQEQPAHEKGREQVSDGDVPVVTDPAEGMLAAARDASAADVARARPAAPARPHLLTRLEPGASTGTAEPPMPARRGPLFRGSGIIEVVFSPDGRLLAAGGAYLSATQRRDSRLSRDNPVVHIQPSEQLPHPVSLWDVTTGQPLQPLIHTGQVAAIAFSPDARLVAAGSRYGTVSLWDTGTGQRLRTLEGSVYNPALAFTRDADGVSKLIATGGGKSMIWGWRADTGMPVPPGGLNTWRQYLYLPSKPVPAPEKHATLPLSRFSPGAEYLTEGRHDQVWLWRAKDLRLHKVLKHTARVRAVAFSPDGERLAVRDEHDLQTIWHTRSGEQVSRFKGNVTEVTWGPISLSQQILATSGGYTDAVHLWNAATGEHLQVLQADQPVSITDLSFSPDSRTLAVGERLLTEKDENQAGENSRIQLWDIPTAISSTSRFP